MIKSELKNYEWAETVVSLSDGGFGINVES